MKVDLEVSIKHDGQKWVAGNEMITACGQTLDELDENIKQIITKENLFKKGSRITVFMGFDFDTIPTWIRQYAYHYFNRLLLVEI